MAFKRTKHLLALLLPASNSAMTSVYCSQWKILFFSYWVLWTSSEWEAEHMLLTFTLRNRNAQTVVLLPPANLSSNPQIHPLPEHLFHWYVCFCKVQNKVFLEQKDAYRSQGNLRFFRDDVCTAKQSQDITGKLEIALAKWRDCWVYLLIFLYWHIWELIHYFDTSSFVSIGVLK